MDSPEYKAMKGSHASRLILESIPISTDDSGYITVTPSSADLTGLSGGNSRRLLLSRVSNSSSDVRRNNSVSLSLSTPRGKRAYRNSGYIESRPKQLQEYFIENTPSLDSCVKNMPLLNRLTANKLPISVQNQFSSGTVIDACDKNNKTPTSQPTIHFEEGMEWSNDNHTETKKNISASGNDKFSTKVLPDVVVNVSSSQPRSVYEFKGNTVESQLPVNAHVTCSSISNALQPSCSSLSKVNVSTGAIPKTYPSKIAISPKTEMFSYSNAPQKYNFKEKYRNNLQLTPQKHDNLASPIFKRDLHKSVKKLNFNSQKIGTPEKNSLLYNNLKPVTLPKKLKSPEKLRSSSISSTKCRKKLFSNINKENSEKTKVDYSGQEYVDFLKMLGDQQNHVPAVKSIFNYLSCKDLMKVCCVSKTWNKVCCNDVQAASRKRVYADDIEMHKENIHIHLQISPNKKSKLEIDPIQYSAKGHKMLMEIDNNNRNRMTQKPPVQRSPPVSPGKRKFKTHINTAKKNPESLMGICVRCNKSATVKSHWAICSGLDCGFHFCTLCHTEYSHGYACCQRPIQSASPSKDSPSKLYIGTKKSRKNLKRL